MALPFEDRIRSMRIVRPMLNSNTYLLIFAVAFMGCVLVTPLVTRVATWLGAIDRPDQFRRIHKGATPRLGGLGLAFGLTMGLAVAALGGYLQDWADYPRWLGSLVPIGLASIIILGVGVTDDTREMKPRLKLLGQASAVLVLYFGGIRIDSITVLGQTIPLDSPSVTVPLWGLGVPIAIPGLVVTMLWFLACMNIWNLIDGMDGLASGVGLLVSGTLCWWRSGWRIRRWRSSPRRWPGAWPASCSTTGTQPASSSGTAGAC